MYIGASQDFRHFFILREGFRLSQGNLVLIPDPVPFFGPYCPNEQFPVPYWVAEFPYLPQTWTESEQWINPEETFAPQQQQWAHQSSPQTLNHYQQWNYNSTDQTLRPHQQCTPQISGQTASAFRAWTPQMGSSFQQWTHQTSRQMMTPHQQLTTHTSIHDQALSANQQCASEASVQTLAPGQQWSTQTAGQRFTPSQQWRYQSSVETPNTSQSGGQILPPTKQWTTQPSAQIPSTSQQWVPQSSAPAQAAKSGHFPFKCPDCHFSEFNTRRGLATHVKAIHNRTLFPLNCDICGQVGFPSRIELRAHSLKHPNALPYPCNYCGNRFRTREAKDFHERTHPKIRPRYTCKFCGRKYTKNTYLKRHLKEVHFAKLWPKGYDSRDLFYVFLLGYGDMEMD